MNNDFLGRFKQKNHVEDTYFKEFSELEISTAIKRIKVLNVFMLVFSAYLFYSDYKMDKILDNKEFTNRLFKIHLYLVFIALIFLIMMFIIKNSSLLMKTIIITLYIGLGISVGILVSLNSAHYDFGITNYITICIFIAIFIPLKPLYLISTYSVMHGLFIIGLPKVSSDQSLIIINQINGTVMFVVSVFLGVIFYFLRKSDFINRKKLIESNANLDALFEISPFSLFIVDVKSNVIIRTNQRARDDFKDKLDKKELVFARDFFVNESDYDNLVKELAANGVIRDYVTELIQNGSKNWVISNCDYIEYEGNRCILVSTVDITAMKMIEAELTRRATTDKLTGILNRSKGIDILEHLFAFKKEFSVVFCDVNSLKMINDIFGHNEGDCVLQLITQGIVDGMSKHDQLFRYGGDEFVVIIKSSQEEVILTRINAIETAIHNIAVKEKKSYTVSASFGYAKTDYNNIFSIEALLSVADKKMYQKKKMYYEQQVNYL